MKEISLRPYNGRLFLATSQDDYTRSCKRMFKHDPVIDCSHGGLFRGGEGRDGMWTYLVWARASHYLAHELSHVALHVFERCGIDPRDSGGEPFCYLLSQLMIDAKG